MIDSPDLTIVQAVWADSADVPPGDGWLTGAEAAVLRGLRFEKRRRDWRVGRWAAKGAVSACVGDVGVGRIEVLASEDGSPAVSLPRGTGGPVALSVSHSAGRGFAVAALGSVALGCDLEALSPRSPAFIRDYLTEAERDAVMALEGPERDAAATLAWAAKEATLKATRQGLRADTRSVEVAADGLLPAGGGWASLTVKPAEAEPFRGWLRTLDGFAWAVVTDATGPAAMVESGRRVKGSRLIRYPSRP